MNELTSLTLHETHDLLTKGEISSVELTKQYFSRIEKYDTTLHCYLTLSAEAALQQAEASDQRLKRKRELTPFTGIPLGLKDIFVTKGIRTTCASKILENYVPPYSGTIVEKLDQAGAILLGKLNMDEFAMGSSNEHSAFGTTLNPWNPFVIPGGSSGGSAAAVAADLCTASLGTDTGGSIRQPAAMCGIVGLKPTYGRVSRYGIIAFASSLDQLGPMTKDVTDAALMMNLIAGRDERDATSLDAPVPDYTKNLSQGIKGMRLGIPKEYFVKGIDPEVEAAVKAAIQQLSELGASIEEVTLPHTEYAIPAYYIIAPAEASSNLARYDGVRYGVRSNEAHDLLELYEKTRSEAFGPEVTLRIMIGTYVLSSGYYDAYYRKAQKVRTLIAQDFTNVFQQVDALVTPTAPTAAFKIGEKTEDPLKMYLNDIFTCPVNLAGLPAISVPCGFTNAKLPIGLQLIGKPLDEATLLRVAYTYEQSTPWHKQKPTL